MRFSVSCIVGLGALHFLVNVTGSAIHVVRYLTKAGDIKYVFSTTIFSLLEIYSVCAGIV